MAAAKLYSQRVTINDRKRDRKRKVDLLKRGVSKEAYNHVFESYYRDQVRALWRAVIDDK